MGVVCYIPRDNYKWGRLVRERKRQKWRKESEGHWQLRRKNVHRRERDKKCMQKRSVPG